MAGHGNWIRKAIARNYCLSPKRERSGRCFRSHFAKLKELRNLLCRDGAKLLWESRRFRRNLACFENFQGTKYVAVQENLRGQPGAWVAPLAIRRPVFFLMAKQRVSRVALLTAVFFRDKTSNNNPFLTAESFWRRLNRVFVVIREPASQFAEFRKPVIHRDVKNYQISRPRARALLKITSRFKIRQSDNEKLISG